MPGKSPARSDGDDRSPVDPLAELARVDLDESGERRARGHELTRERLPGRARAPDDRRAAAREQCPAQEMHLAAAKRIERVRRLRAREPARVVAPAVDERVHIAKPAPAFPDPENEVVVLGPALVAVGDELGPGGQAGAGQRALDPEIVLRGLDGDERVQPVGVRAHPAGGVGEVLDPAADRGEPFFLDRRHLQLEPLGQRHVVGVHPCKQRRARLAAGALGGGDHSGRLLVQNSEPRVAAGVGLEDPGRRVYRPVVDGDHLEVRERLRRERLEALGEKRLLVPHRQQDGYLRTAHSAGEATGWCRRRSR